MDIKHTIIRIKVLLVPRCRKKTRYNTMLDSFFVWMRTSSNPPDINGEITCLKYRGGDGVKGGGIIILASFPEIFVAKIR